MSVLRDFFPRMKSDSLNSFHYLDGPDNLNVTVEISKNLKVKKFSAETGSTKRSLRNLRQTVDSAFNDLQPNKIIRSILMSSRPIDGYFRWEDSFQILPVPPTAPRQPFPFGPDNPFILETSYTPSLSRGLSSYRSYKRTHEVTMSLLAVLGGAIMPRKFESNYVWTTNNNDDPKYNHCGYILQDFEFDKDEFTTHNWPEIKRVAEDIKIPMGLDENNRYFDIPENIEQDLTIISSLSKENFDRFQRSAFWLSKAFAGRDSSISIKCICLINAIESLLPSENLQKHQSGCRDGISDEFARFIFDYSGVPISYSKYIYDIRSRLVHGNAVFDDDLHNFSTSMGKFSGSRQLIPMIEVVYRAIQSWFRRVGESETQQ